DVTVTEHTRMLSANLLDQNAFQQAIRSGPRVEALRKLLGAWMQRATGQAALRALTLAMQYNWKEGLDLGLRLVRNKDFASGMAVLAIGKLGTKEQVPVLTGLLDNTTVLLNVNFNNKPGTMEVRDVALAMLVHLSGQPIRDYGFEFFQGTSNDQVFFVP